MCWRGRKIQPLQPHPSKSCPHPLLAQPLNGGALVLRLQNVSGIPAGIKDSLASTFPSSSRLTVSAYTETFVPFEHCGKFTCKLATVPISSWEANFTVTAMWKCLSSLRRIICLYIRRPKSKGTVNRNSSCPFELHRNRHALLAALFTVHCHRRIADALETAVIRSGRGCRDGKRRRCGRGACRRSAGRRGNDCGGSAAGRKGRGWNGRDAALSGKPLSDTD